MPAVGNNASENTTIYHKISSSTRSRSSANFSQSGVSLGIGSYRLNGDDGFIDSGLQGSQILDVKESQDLGSFVQIFITSIKTKIRIFKWERFSLGYHRAGVLQRSLVQPGGDKLADGKKGYLVVGVLGNLGLLREKSLRARGIILLICPLGRQLRLETLEMRSPDCPGGCLRSSLVLQI